MIDGLVEMVIVGELDLFTLGVEVGIFVSLLVGLEVGLEVGLNVGIVVGTVVGDDVIFAVVTFTVGSVDGIEVSTFSF